MRVLFLLFCSSWVLGASSATWDVHGVPKIQGKSIEEILEGQGRATAKDRIFQMDLIRRQTAGRLAEILGPSLAESDRVHRIWGLGHVAEAASNQMDPTLRKRYEAYASGVNYYLKELTEKPTLEFETLKYLPEPWSVVDSLLVQAAMAEDLDLVQIEGESFESNTSDIEEAITSLYQKRSKSLADFLTPVEGFWDVPLLPEKSHKLIPIPTSKEFQWKKPREKRKSAARSFTDPFPIGSNAWVLHGSKTESGLPLLANDPHLNLRAPNIFYRIQFAGALNVSGVSVPGIPGVVIGQNRDVAWGLTSGEADRIDLIPLKSIEKKRIQKRKETLKVRGGKDISLVVEETEWGPVIRDHVMQWVLLDPKVLKSADFIELNQAQSVESAFQAMSAWGGAALNLLAASKTNHIGWKLIGKLPHRFGFDGRVATKRDPKHAWKGYIPSSEMPELKDPESGWIVSANQRTVAMDSQVFRFGNNWAPPFRAHRIQELLLKKEKWNREGMREIQLDTQSEIHVWYRDQLLEVLSEKDSDPWLQTVAKIISKWNGKAEADSAGYSILQEFRAQVLELFLNPLWDGIEGRRKWFFQDAVMKRLLEEKPIYLLPPKFSSYPDVLKAAVRSTIEVFKSRHLIANPSDLGSLKWGELNPLAIRHPLGAQFPVLKLPGGAYTVRANYKGSASAVRIIFDLSDPKKSLFAQPGGQSGDPKSSHFSDLLEAWTLGEMIPLTSE